MELEARKETNLKDGAKRPRARFFLSFFLYIDKINRQVMNISAHMWLINGGVTICKDARRGLDSASLQAASGLVKLTRTEHENIPTSLPSSSNIM